MENKTELDKAQVRRELDLMKNQIMDMFHRLTEMRSRYDWLILIENAQGYCRFLHYELDKIKNKNTQNCIDVADGNNTNGSQV